MIKVVVKTNLKVEGDNGIPCIVNTGTVITAKTEEELPKWVQSEIAAKTDFIEVSILKDEPVEEAPAEKPAIRKK